jgi:hypothetical protein
MMRLTIQIDKEINVALLLEQLSLLSSNVNVNLPNRELTIITDQPGAVLAVYQNHDASQQAGADAALLLRRQAAANLGEELTALDLTTATLTQMAMALRLLLRYMQVRMASEGE